MGRKTNENVGYLKISLIGGIQEGRVQANVPIYSQDACQC